MSKRISFNEHDAAALYEWGLAARQCDPEMIDNCVQCAPLSKRLEKFIGTRAKELQDLMEKFPYHRES